MAYFHYGIFVETFVCTSTLLTMTTRTKALGGRTHRLILLGGGHISSHCGHPERPLLENIPERIQHFVPERSSILATHDGFYDGEFPLLRSLDIGNMISHQRQGTNGGREGKDRMV